MTIGVRPFFLSLGASLFLSLSVHAQHRALLPQPQKLDYGSHVVSLVGASVVLPDPLAPEDEFAGEQLAGGISHITGSEVPLTPNHTGLKIILKRTGAVDALPAMDEKPGPDSRESYQITIHPNEARIEAKSSAGLYYGVETFLQMIEKQGKEAVIPEATVTDWPSLAYRGVMMDLSHGPLPTEAEVKRELDSLAKWKGNQYYLYSELSIELKGFPLINPTARYTQDQVRSIVAYGRQRHVDVVPCVEFYGHLHDLFRIERYADLAALPHGTEINPNNTRMQELLANWAAQMADLFPSPWIHIGLDEPWELERAGAAAAGNKNPEEIYVGNLKRLSTVLTAKGKRVLFWADIHTGAALFDKYPNLMTDLPPGVVAVPWQYDDQKDYSPMVEPFQKANIPEIIATGIWAWESMAPDFELTFNNIDGFLRDGRKFGTIGIINTNWSDAAQVLFRSTLPGIAYGVISAWQQTPINRDHFFEDYCDQMYTPDAAKEAAAALQALSKASVLASAALGSENIMRLWDDPFTKTGLDRSAKNKQQLIDARLASEEAQEHFYNAIALSGDTYSLPSLLLDSRLIDYAGMKFLYSTELVEAFSKINSKSTRADAEFWLNRQAGSRNHARMEDLMDTINELEEIYNARWLDEYTPYRLDTALGRFHAEAEFWRRLQAKTWEVEHSFKPGMAIPSITELAGSSAR